VPYELTFILLWLRQCIRAS